MESLQRYKNEEALKKKAVLKKTTFKVKDFDKLSDDARVCKRWIEIPVRDPFSELYAIIETHHLQPSTTQGPVVRYQSVTKVRADGQRESRNFMTFTDTDNFYRVSVLMYLFVWFLFPSIYHF